MLKVNMSVHELYSHRVSATEDWDLEYITEFVTERKITSMPELLEKITATLNEDYRNGYAELEGNTGDGEPYPGNDGHDALNIEMEFPPELEVLLQPFFFVAK